MRINVRNVVGERPSDYKSKAIAEINRVIGNVRGKYITIMPGQDMVYMQKEKEAIAFIKEYEFDNPNEEDYPHLLSEVGITGDDCYQVAMIILNMAAYWRVKSSQIDGVKLSHIKQVEQCQSFDECENIMELFRQNANML